MRRLLPMLCLLSVPAQARITSLDIIAQDSFAAGAVFGVAGRYVRIRAIAHGELDPAAPGDAAIALIEVEYDTDVIIMHPADPARARGILLYDVGIFFLPTVTRMSLRPRSFLAGRRSSLAACTGLHCPVRVARRSVCGGCFEGFFLCERFVLGARTLIPTFFRESSGCGP